MTSNPTHEVIRTDVAIIGGGPAGMAAARELAGAGVESLILDEGQRLGGQIFRQLPESFRGGPQPGFVAPGHAAGHRLIDTVTDHAISVHTGVTVWDVRPGHVWAEGRRGGLEVQAQRIILATGAMDRSLPFPGWTLPGVTTAGAAQVMVRGNMIRPGDRAIVAGTGPLLLPTVTALLSAGVEVVALLEANRMGGVLRTLPAVLGNRHRRRETWHYVRRLLGRRVRMQFGRAVFAAHGKGRVQRVVTGRLDRDGHPLPGTEREVHADLVCVGFGLLPAIELAVRMGCGMHHRELRGGWLPEHDEDMRTTVPGVSVAGEIAGIGGGDVAMAEGALAGRAVALDLRRGGHGGSTDTELAALRHKCAAERRATDALLAAFPVLPGLYDLAQPETIVCRCEDVSFAEVKEASRVYGCDIRSIKVATRAGMGPCQARVCHRILGGLLRERLDSDERPTPCPVVQVPVKPVAVRTVAGRGDAC